MNVNITPAINQKNYGKVFAITLAITPLIALIAPRFLAFWPGIIGLCSLAAYPLSFGHKPILPRTALYWIIALLLLCGASTLWALSPDTTFSRFIKTTPILLSGLALLSICLSVPFLLIKPYLKFIVWTTIGSTLFCAVELSANFPLFRLTHGMAFSEEVAPANMNRSIIALLCFLFIALAIAKKMASKSALRALFAVFVLTLALTESQSAQLGFALALLFYFAFPYGHKWAWTALTALLAIAVMAAPFLAIWLFDHTASSINQMPFLGRGDGFGGQRLEIWNNVSHYALQNPFYGFGMEATRAVPAFESAQLYRKGVTELHPHNFAVQLWIEFGVLGALLCSALFAQIMRTLSARGYHQARIALPTFMVLLTAAAFGYGLWQAWLVGLMIAALSLCALTMRLYAEENEIKTKPSANGE